MLVGSAEGGVIKDSLEITGAKQALGFAKGKLHSGDTKSALNASQLLTAFGATTSQNQTAVFGSHTSTEAVVANALDVAGLECSFHDTNLL